MVVIKWNVCQISQEVCGCDQVECLSDITGIVWLWSSGISLSDITGSVWL